MRKKIKELYEHSTLVAKIRYSYLCLLVPFVLFLIFCFYNLWNNNRRYEDMINSSVMASQFSLDFQKDFDYETYLLIVGNKTLEESSLHDMLVEADGIVAGLWWVIPFPSTSITRSGGFRRAGSNIRISS